MRRSATSRFSIGRSHARARGWLPLFDQENRQPKPQPEEGEFIQVMRVPLKSLSQELTKLQKRGVMPISGGVK